MSAESHHESRAKATASEPSTMLTVDGRSVKGMKLSRQFDMSNRVLSKKKG